MNAGPRYLEVLALVFGLGGLTILSITMIKGYRFNRQVRVSRRIDPREQKRFARQTILGFFVTGICMAATGLSLSLWSPVGLKRLTIYEVLFSFLLFGGSSVLLGALLYYYIIARWKALLRMWEDK